MFYLHTHTHTQMKQFAALNLRRGSNTGTPSIAGEGDNTSISGADEATLQEAYMGIVRVVL